MIPDYLNVGGIEVINTARLQSHLRALGSPFTSGVEICTCPTLTEEQLDPEGRPYTTPDDPANPAPWYDEDVPESGSFIGFLPLSIDGLDSNPVTRTVTNAVRGGGALGPLRVRPRTITVTGLLIGATCCATDYGLHWLAEALRGCTGGMCGGDCVTMLNCCPDSDMPYEEFNERHRRTLRRVALVEGPTVTARQGTDGACGKCGAGSDILTVEFVLVAATPWAWTDEVPVLDAPIPTDDGTQCIKWCLPDSTDPECQGPCRFGECVDAASACADPTCAPPTPPVPTSPDTCLCEALAVNRECYDIDLTWRPAWSSDVPMITVEAGSKDLRHVEIALYERRDVDENLSCEEIADQKRCDPFAVWEVGYVPAGGILVLDGQIGRATVDCGGACESSRYVTGEGGTPAVWPEIDCGTLCLCISSDALVPPASDASIKFAVSGRGY